MRAHLKYGFFFTMLLGICMTARAQKRDTMVVHQTDTIVVPPVAAPQGDTSEILTRNPLAMDTAVSKTFNPKVATMRSAILPGWGQAYNKKYWKIPIVYGALGVSAGFFFYNLKSYRQLRQAVIYRRDTIPGNDELIAPELRVLSTEALVFYRNSVRQDIDYSVLAFLLVWGLNVVDATVDAHLKAFDVSPDLSLKIKPQYYLESNSAGLSLVFHLKRRENNFAYPR